MGGREGTCRPPSKREIKGGWGGGGAGYLQAPRASSRLGLNIISDRACVSVHSAKSPCSRDSVFLEVWDRGLDVFLSTRNHPDGWFLTCA